LEDGRVFIDIRKSSLTVSETLAEIKKLQEENPNMEFFIDGDAHAIIGREKR
jgi:hypothetical protein